MHGLSWQYKSLKLAISVTASLRLIHVMYLISDWLPCMGAHIEGSIRLKNTH